ncbi:MAG: DUF3791 domain-containing protein [Clostridiales bacterium]|nr:DUF3791 domain-containing protein [Clostridiales bacterium]
MTHLQTEIAHAYMRQHSLTPSNFVDLDLKYGILHFIEIGYEPSHLTGTQGVVDEVESYVQLQEDQNS